MIPANKVLEIGLSHDEKHIHYRWGCWKTNLYTSLNTIPLQTNQVIHQRLEKTIQCATVGGIVLGGKHCEQQAGCIGMP